MNLFLNIGLVCVVIAGAYRVNEGLSKVGTILAFMTYFYNNFKCSHVYFQNVCYCIKGDRVSRAD